jgi:hypothetical protein
VKYPCERRVPVAASTSSSEFAGSDFVDEDELAAAERRVVDLVGRVDQPLPSVGR